MTRLRGPLIGLNFMRNNSVAIDTTHDLQTFFTFDNANQTASNWPNSKPSFVFTDNALAIPPRTTKIVTAFVKHPSEWSTTCTVTALENFTETVSLLISYPMPTLFEEEVAVRVTNKAKSTCSHKKITKLPSSSTSLWSNPIISHQLLCQPSVWIQRVITSWLLN